MPLFKKMFHDLKCDFKRYCEFNELGNKPSSFEKIKVLLKSPSFFAIIVYRFGFWINSHYKEKKKSPAKCLLKFIYYLGKYLSVILLKISISNSSVIGSGLYLSNKGHIIMGVKKMGNGCTIHNNITIGMGKEKICPEIGDNVIIESDSIIYGQITIGSGTQIIGGSVLSKSVPGKCIVKGNPARIIKRNVTTQVHSSRLESDED